MIFLKTILFIWQLPQNILGSILCLIERTKKARESGITYHETKKPGPFMKRCAISLGAFIIADSRVADKTTILHESGHQRQSLFLGPLYLLVIGIPSLCGNLTDRLMHRKWSDEKREKWYHSLPWESSADKLGNRNEKKL